MKIQLDKLKFNKPKHFNVILESKNGLSESVSHVYKH